LTASEAAIAAVMVLLIYNLAALGLGTDGLLQRVPDDAFYYLVLGKNFAAKGFWTFDGSAVASGFHILFGYLIALVYKLHPDIGFHAVYSGVVFLNVVLVGAAVLLLCQACEQTGITNGNFGILLVAISSVGLRMAGFPMECCLVIFFSAAAFWLAVPGRSSGPATLTLAGLVGVLGVLSRSDWGALPFAMLAGAMVRMWATGTRDRNSLGVIAAMCAAAVLGELLVAWHTHAFTGNWVQRSASIKSHWASVQGYSVLPGMARVVELLSPAMISRVLMAPLIAILALGTMWSIGLRRLMSHALLVSALLIITGYWAVYALNGSVQYWYAASFFAAVAVLSAVLWSNVGARWDGLRVAILALFLASAAYQSLNPPWTWAPAMRAAGEHLRTQPELTPVGAWNAGIISYMAGRPVINLDGLVNDEVYPAVVSGRLADYIAARGIRYLIDFADIFSNMGGRRGGYADGRLFSCITPLRTFESHRTFAGTALTLYEVDVPCLKKAPTTQGAEMK
jgi:hypothetical protein